MAPVLAASPASLSVPPATCEQIEYLKDFYARHFGWNIGGSEKGSLYSYKASCSNSESHHYADDCWEPSGLAPPDPLDVSDRLDHSEQLDQLDLLNQSSPILSPHISNVSTVSPSPTATPPASGCQIASNKAGAALKISTKPKSSPKYSLQFNLNSIWSDKGMCSAKGINRSFIISNIPDVTDEILACFETKIAFPYDSKELVDSVFDKFSENKHKYGKPFLIGSLDTNSIVHLTWTKQKIVAFLYLPTNSKPIKATKLSKKKRSCACFKYVSPSSPLIHADICTAKLTISKKNHSGFLLLFTRSPTKREEKFHNDIFNLLLDINYQPNNTDSLRKLIPKSLIKSLVGIVFVSP